VEEYRKEKCSILQIRLKRLLASGILASSSRVSTVHTIVRTINDISGMRTADRQVALAKA